MRVKELRHITFICLLVFLVACGSDTGNNNGEDDVAIAINPVRANLEPNEPQEFTVTVTGTPNTAVTWKANGGAISGTSSTILYTAPDAAGTYTVTATSQADTSKSANAVVDVVAGSTPPPTPTPPAPPPPTPTPPEPTPPEPTPTPPTSVPNNSATLTGETIGDGSVSNDQLHKEIGLNLVKPNSNFSLGKAYAVADTVRSKDFAINWVIPVTNTSNQLHCFIELETILYKDADGNTLSTDVGSFVDGSIAEDSIGYNDTCLAPGEQGYFTGIDITASYDTVASLEIADLTNSDFDFTVSEAKVIPQSYSVEQAVGSLQDVYTNIRNEGPATVELVGVSTSILLDADGVPLYWAFSIPTDDWDGILSPNQTNQMDDLFGYEGTADKLYVSLSFDRPRNNSRVGASQLAHLQRLANQGFISEDELRERLWEERTARLKADLQRLEQTSTE